MQKKQVSFIFPIYNESGNIDKLYREICLVLGGLAKTYSFELIFINDGSTDNSLEILHKLLKTDPRVVVINFARNFGHQVAVTAGLDHAQGDCAIIMDSDLQDPPKVCKQLLDKWSDDYDVVYAQRRSRRDGIFKRGTAFIFYLFLQKVTSIDIPRDTGDFRLIDRKVIDAIKRFKEHDRFLRGLVSYVGFRQVAVPFDRDERYAGQTGYPLKKMLKFAADGIFGFSTAPLKLISRIGYFFSVLSFLGILYALFMKITSPSTAVPGWTFIIITILLVGGVQMIMLGVLGSYTGRIYTESRDRPLYLIESVKKR